MENISGNLEKNVRDWNPKLPVERNVQGKGGFDMTDKERRDRVRVDTSRPIEFIFKEHFYFGSIKKTSLEVVLS